MRDQSGLFKLKSQHLRKRTGIEVSIPYGLVQGRQGGFEGQGAGMNS